MARLQIMTDEGVSAELALPDDTATASERCYLVDDAASGGVRIRDDRPERFVGMLVRTPRYWVLLPVPGGVEIQVNGVPVVGLRVLDEGDRIEWPGVRLRFAQERVERLDAQSALVQQDKACPVCTEPFQPDDRVIYCPVCGLAHHYGKAAQHEDCWGYYGKCASQPFCGHVQG